MWHTWLCYLFQWIHHAWPCWVLVVRKSQLLLTRDWKNWICLPSPPLDTVTVLKRTQFTFFGVADTIFWKISFKYWSAESTMRYTLFWTLCSKKVNKTRFCTWFIKLRSSIKSFIEPYKGKLKGPLTMTHWLSLPFSFEGDHHGATLRTPNWELLYSVILQYWAVYSLFKTQNRVLVCHRISQWDHLHLKIKLELHKTSFLVF